MAYPPFNYFCKFMVEKKNNKKTGVTKISKGPKFLKLPPPPPSPQVKFCHYASDIYPYQQDRIYAYIFQIIWEYKKNYSWN